MELNNEKKCKDKDLIWHIVGKMVKKIVLGKVVYFL